jgi:hypothetical protein
MEVIIRSIMTQLYNYAMHTPKEIFEVVEHAKVFTTLDL